MANLNPVEFMKEVRQEVAKVTWPTRKEVWITTVMVLFMVAFASVFFLVVDQVLSRIVRFVLGLGA
jgi:preprotein translocase subunit SecE